MLAEDRDYAVRFGGIGRLYGRLELERLKNARVLVVGLGGVGSWTVEALARSGIGHLALVDPDEVCVSNTNRQLHALTRDMGKAKAVALRERMSEISPGTEVAAILRFFNPQSADSILASGFDLVVDAIDHYPNKCLLLAECRRRGLPAVTCGGAGGRRDPTRIEVADLARTYDDPLLSLVRKRLRDHHGFPHNKRERWNIDCVFSTESPVFPQSDGTVCGTRETGAAVRLNCESGYGTATFLTGTFGFHLAALAVNKLTAMA